MNGHQPHGGYCRTALLMLVPLALLLGGCSRRPPAPGPVSRPEPPAQTTVKVYFADPETAMLKPVERTVSADYPLDEALQALAEGPRPGEGLDPVLPGPEALRGLSVRGDVVVVDLSGDFAQAMPGGAAGLLTIYGIVNTLTGIGGIEFVQFRVEGEAVEALGELDGRAPFRYKADMVVGEGESA